MKAYRIVGWRERYEVTDQGRAAAPGQQVRVKPLPFARLKVFGYRKGASWRRLECAAKTPARLESCFAVFCKLLELAADQVRDRRGWILTDQGLPATAAEIAFYTGFRESSISMALAVLSDTSVRWIEQANTEKPTGTLRRLKKVAANETKPKPNSTELNGTKPNSLKVQPTPPAEGGAPDGGKRPELSFGSSASISTATLPSPETQPDLTVKLKLEQLLPSRLPCRSTADRTTVNGIARRASAGMIGPPAEAMVVVLEQARLVAKNPGVIKKMAYFVTWFKGELEKNGHAWKDIPDTS